MSPCCRLGVFPGLSSRPFSCNVSLSASFLIQLATASLLSITNVFSIRRWQWERFRDCSPLPNALSLAEVNTYITEAGEREDVSVADSLAAAEYTEQIVVDVERAVARATEQGDAALVRRPRCQCRSARVTRRVLLWCAAPPLAALLIVDCPSSPATPTPTHTPQHTRTSTHTEGHTHTDTHITGRSLLQLCTL